MSSHVYTYTLAMAALYSYCTSLTQKNVHTHLEWQTKYPQHSELCEKKKFLTTKDYNTSISKTDWSHPSYMWNACRAYTRMLKMADGLGRH